MLKNPKMITNEPIFYVFDGGWCLCDFYIYSTLPVSIYFHLFDCCSRKRGHMLAQTLVELAKVDREKTRTTQIGVAENLFVKS